MLLYQAFGWSPPRFAHLPLLLNEQRRKLSKRADDMDIASIVDQGFLPDALLNAVAFLGWNPKNSEREIFTLTELCNEVREVDFRSRKPLDS